MRLLLSLFLLLPLLCRGGNWDAESIRQALDRENLDPIEGVWQFPDDGAVMLITRASATTFDIVLLDSPRLDVPPGVTIGTATLTPTEGIYDAKLDNKPLGSNSLKKSTTTIAVTSDGVLRIKPYSEGWTVSLRRWIPYFLRVSIKENLKPEGLTGARRIYPAAFKPVL